MAHHEYDADLSLALSLQDEFDRETALNKDPSPMPSSSAKKIQRRVLLSPADQQPEILNVIDASWELVDPTPDIHALFVQFNRTFFWNELNVVEIKWSGQLTSSAGNCSYSRRSGSCVIKLSSPLLRLRPRKDLVETLLHEMIHAYLFVTKNNRDHGAHGPEFVKHMERLNRRTGAKISIYHSFHDEVNLYKVHWWQCNGPCKARHPYYGLVKSARNRAPGPSYNWWSYHQSSCNGTYVKIKGPEISQSQETKPKGTFLSQQGSPPKNVSPKSTFVPFTSNGHVLGGSTVNDSNDAKARRLLAMENLVVGRQVKTKTPSLPKKRTPKKVDNRGQPRLNQFFQPLELPMPGKPGLGDSANRNLGTAVSAKKFSESKRAEAFRRIFSSDSSDDDGSSAATEANRKTGPTSSILPRKLGAGALIVQKNTIATTKNSARLATIKKLIFSDSSDDEQQPARKTVVEDRTPTSGKRDIVSDTIAGPPRAAIRVVGEPIVGQAKIKIGTWIISSDDECDLANAIAVGRKRFLASDSSSKTTKSTVQRSGGVRKNQPSPPYLVIDSSDDEVIRPSPEAKKSPRFCTSSAKKLKIRSGFPSSLKILSPTPSSVATEPIAHAGDSNHRLIQCPSCGLQVASLRINQHLDECLHF